VATLRELPVDAPEAHGLLSEYFDAREQGFRAQGVDYSRVYPSADVFTPPAGAFLVVVDDDGDAVGCGGIRRLGADAGGATYEVKHLYLRPETRGRGWGRMLLAALEARAVGFGATELVLDTHHSLTAAAGLYASAGFGTIDPYNDNPNATRWYGKPVGTPGG
jgi:ribosomal protein S18 acetylase RimI-like enzyme